jgi:CRP/FNR family transcriptional regulator
VLAGSRPVQVSARALTHNEGEAQPHLELVVEGVVRVFVSADDGRTMTVGYCRPGCLIGVMSLFMEDCSTEDCRMPVYTQALTDTSLLRLVPSTVSHAARDNGVIAVALLHELSEAARQFIHEFPGSVFTTVRQRVARHLLDLAADGPSLATSGACEPLTVIVSQRDLADAVGSVREVVARALSELQGAGMVCTYRDHIEILDPVRLSREQAGT